MNALYYPVPGLGMTLVAVFAAGLWLRRSGQPARWTWAGAGLWTVAVAVKMIIAVLINAAVISFLAAHLSHGAMVLTGSVFIGLQSTICEMGLTWLAGRIWPVLGRGGARAVGVGVGAGSFEALLLGLAALVL